MTEIEKIAVIEGLVRVRTYYNEIVKSTVKEVKVEEKQERWNNVEELSDIEKFTTFLGEAEDEYDAQETIVQKADERVLQLITSIIVI